jgi:heptosyltransferase-3
MNPALISAERLAKADKILFITHLALGDYLYLQNFFLAFSKAYPHIKIDLWVDEVRRTDDEKKWPFLKQYALYDWVESCSFFRKIYRKTYSPALYDASIKEANRENYPLVVSLATLRPHQYATLARKISPDGFVVGMRKKVKLFTLHHLRAYKQLDAAILPYKKPADYQHHITDEYADWFHQVGNITVTGKDRLPFVSMPSTAKEDAQAMLADWGVDTAHRKLVFINPFAKTHKRCWPLQHVAELVRRMQSLPHWKEAFFIVNAVPQELEQAGAVISSYQLSNTRLFSATENFFQLPAVLAECDLIISVETAVMHLANAVHVPVIALMRQKTPEWVPIDKDNSTVIMASGRREWVKAISVDDVMKVLSDDSASKH